MEECYRNLGGDFDQVKQRLMSISLIERFIAKFLADDSYSQLCHAMQAGERKEAFRAAHTLKGVSANLGFDRLVACAGELTELLRPAGETLPEGAGALFEAVKGDYAQTVNAIRAYLETAD